MLLHTSVACPEVCCAAPPPCGTHSAQPRFNAAPIPTLAVRQFTYEIAAPGAPAAAASGRATFSFVTQRQDYTQQQDRLCTEVEAAAAAERAAGGGGGGGVARRRGPPRTAGGGSRSSSRYEEREVAAGDGSDGSDGSGGGGEGDIAGGGGRSSSGGAGAPGGRSRKKAKRLNL